MKELIKELTELRDTIQKFGLVDEVILIHQAIQALLQSENKPITKEEIEYRIKEEFKKHKELDWAKIAASKIYALLPQESEGEKERAIEFSEFISKNCFYRNASETNMLWATNDNDYYSGCLYTNDELYKEFLKTK